MQPTLENIKRFMQWWNVTYPLDRWWRQKHNVAFNSPKHRSMNFIDMKIEFEEDLLYKQIGEDKKKEQSYKPGRGDWLNKPKRVKMTEEEIDDLFEQFDPGKAEYTEDGRLKL